MIRFDTRSAWAVHEFSQHRYLTEWTCPQCDQAYNDPLLWEKHLSVDHKTPLSGEKLQALLSAVACKTFKQSHEEVCNLCKCFQTRNKREFVTHVCQHMEDIALMAIPRVQIEEDNASDATNEIFDKQSLDSWRDLGVPQPVAINESSIAPNLPQTYSTQGTLERKDSPHSPVEPSENEPKEPKVYSPNTSNSPAHGFFNSLMRFFSGVMSGDGTPVNRGDSSETPYTASISAENDPHDDRDPTRPGASLSPSPSPPVKSHQPPSLKRPSTEAAHAPEQSHKQTKRALTTLPSLPSSPSHYHLFPLEVKPRTQPPPKPLQSRTPTRYVCSTF